MTFHRTAVMLSLITLATTCVNAQTQDEIARATAREELKSLGGELQKVSRVFNLIHSVVAPSVVAIHTRSQDHHCPQLAESGIAIEGMAQQTLTLSPSRVCETSSLKWKIQGPF